MSCTRRRDDERKSFSFPEGTEVSKEFGVKEQYYHPPGLKKLTFVGKVKGFHKAILNNNNNDDDETTTTKVDDAEWHYLVEFYADDRMVPDFKGSESFIHLMTEDEVDTNPYRLWTNHFGSTFVPDEFAYSENSYAPNWKDFLKDLNKVPEIAKLKVDEQGAPSLMYVLLDPGVPYEVVERLLEINPTAVNYIHEMCDICSWLHNVVTFAGDGYYSDKSFTKQIDPKIMSLLIKNITNGHGRHLTKQDINGCVPIEKFVEDDTKNLTPQARAILEVSFTANIYVLCKYRDDKYKLGGSAVKFCLDLIENPNSYHQNKYNRKTTREAIEKIKEKLNKDKETNSNSNSDVGVGVDVEAKKPEAKKQRTS